MKPICASILFFVAQCGISGNVNADSDQNTIQCLYEQCTSKEPVASAFCVGYVGGVASAMFIAANLGWCPDAPVTAAQMVKMFKNWHDKNPKLWNKDEALGVIPALQEAWPCASY